MKMIGISVRSASCCCSSRPLRPGSVTSSTRQHGTVGARAGQELPCRREGFGSPARVLDQQLQRFAHRDVVVDDEDNGCGIRHGDDLESSGAVDGSTVYIPRETSSPVTVAGYLISSATATASSSAVSLNGLKRHATAPPASRRGRSDLSPCAVMKTIGIVAAGASVPAAGPGRSCPGARRRGSGSSSGRARPTPETPRPMRTPGRRSRTAAAGRAATRAPTRCRRPPSPVNVCPSRRPHSACAASRLRAMLQAMETRSLPRARRTGWRAANLPRRAAHRARSWRGRASECPPWMPVSIRL